MTRRPRYAHLQSVAFFAFCTLAFSWPAVTIPTFSSHLQSLDSALMTAILSHTCHALFASSGDFWTLEMFHPIKDTLCYSEPMLLPAIVCAPIFWAFGSVVAANFWILFCYFTSAYFGWLYLSRRFGHAPALWGSFFATWTPIHFQHAIGQYHLLFHAGFPLLLLLTELMLRRARLRLAVLLIVAIVAQVLAGFYLTVIFLIWMVFMIPACMAESSGRTTGGRTNTVKCCIALAIAGIASALILVPIAIRYMQVGAGFWQNSQKQVSFFSATWKSYLVPPCDTVELVTLPGVVCSALFGAEDHYTCLYLGLAAIALLVCAIWRLLVQTRTARFATYVYSLAALAAGAMFFVLSLGPYSTEGNVNSVRLPFAFLYAKVEAIRFFRATDRFSIGVIWCVAILATSALAFISTHLRRAKYHQMSKALPGICLLVTMVEFYPLTRIQRIPAAPGALGRFLRNETGRKAMVSIPVGPPEFLMELPTHYEPYANGHSGYIPLSRSDELRFFESHFPANEALVLLERWKTDRVLIRSRASDSVKSSAKSCASLKHVWSGPEGDLYDLSGPRVTFAEFYRDLVATSARADLLSGTLEFCRGGIPNPQHPVELSGNANVVEGVGARVSFMLEDGKANLAMRFTKSIPAALYTKLAIRAKIDNWYAANELGAVSWEREGAAPGEPEQVHLFYIRADGKYHDVEIDLGTDLNWLMSTPVRSMGLHFGLRERNVVTIEDLRLEYGEMDIGRWVRGI